MTSITIRIPAELKRSYQKAAREEGTSKSLLIRDALERYMAVKTFRSLREKTLPYAARSGILTDEDVFRVFKRTSRMKRRTGR
jgi:predicted transcriptional regulator